MREEVEAIRARWLYRVDGFNEDASSRLAFGLCKKYGIDLPKDAKPADAWKALKEKTGKSARDFYNNSGTEGADKIRFNTANVKTFTKNLDSAKQSQNPEDAWRVTGMGRDDLRNNHPNAKLHVTDGGSTIAVDDGDIVAVCKNKNDNISGGDLLRFAVKNGGDKLDSYEGNHEFYVRNGFEPVSWCAWDDAYAGYAKDQGWNPDRDAKESIIFYKYVGPGNVKIKDRDDVFSKIPVSKDYDEAMEKRNADMKRGKK